MKCVRPYCCEEFASFVWQFREEAAYDDGYRYCPYCGTEVVVE